MRRDAALIKKVLMFVEEHGSRMFKGTVPIDGYDRNAIVYHLYLLESGGFLELGRETLADKGPLMLTWKGCDYLDQLRARESRKGTDEHRPEIVAR